MEPIKNVLTRPVRIAIMVGFIFVFFASAPVVVLYTQGFRVDWSKWKILGTGVLSVDAEPSAARLFLNEMPIEAGMPIWLANLAPGSYRLGIEGQGFLPWKKTVEIESNRTTYIRNIRLIKDSSWHKAEEDETIFFASHDPMPRFPNLPESFQTLFANDNGKRVVGFSKETLEVFERDEDQWRILFSLKQGKVELGQKKGVWILFSPWEVWRLKEDGRPELLYRTSRPLKKALPLFGESLLLATETDLMVFDPRFGLEQSILENAKIEDVLILKKEEKSILKGTINQTNGIFERAL